MKTQAAKKISILGGMTLVGITLGFLFWMFETLVHVYFFNPQKESVFRHFFYPDTHELWMRSFVTVLFMLFGFYAQYIVNVRKRAEKELNRQNIFYDRTIESLTHPFYVIDVNTYKIRIANSAACEHELTKDGKLCKGKSCKNFTCYEATHKRNNPCTGLEHECPLEEVKRTKHPVTVEHIHYDLTGAFKNVEIHAYPIFDDKGNVTEMIEYSLDVTERKKSEKALKDAHDNLEARVKERTGELAKTNKALIKAAKDLEKTNTALQESQVQLVQSEKMASLGQLAAGIAHEINNPTGFILSNLNTLSEYVKVFKKLLEQYASLFDALEKGESNDKVFSEIAQTRKDPGLEYILNDIDALFKETRMGADRVKDIVGGLRSFAHADETKMVEADINRCIENTLKIVWSEMKYKCELRKDLKKLPLIRCHPGQLNQVFMNILMNAIQAIPDEGGLVTIETKAGKTGIIVKISDTGVGISPENLSKIFDPFFTTKPVGKGTGLGLSISHGIIKRHAGTIEVESELLKGTTFTVRLPIKNGQ